MTYFTALGAITRSDWCSAPNPQLDCNVRGPFVCHPRYPKTLDVFRRIQETVNAIAAAEGFSRIAVDGDIGPQTVEGVNRALGTSYGRCDGVAGDADQVLRDLVAAARAAGASAPPKTRPLPPSIDPEDAESLEEAREAMNLEPTRSGFLVAVTKPTTLIGLGIAAAGIWYLNRQTKRGKTVGWI